MKQALRAFLYAPSAPFLIYIFLGGFGLFIILFGLPIAYGTAIIAGIPAFFLIKSKPSLQNSITYVTLGACFGIIAAIIFWHTIGWQKIKGFAPWFGLHGAASGYIFWRIVRKELLKQKPTRADAITSYQFFRKLTALPFVQAIYLYGSRARGDHDDWSDIDLAILCPTATPEQWAEIQDIVTTQEVLIPITVTRYDTLTDAGFKAQIDKDKKELFRRHG